MSENIAASDGEGIVLVGHLDETEVATSASVEANGEKAETID